jgi:hypothetical protein
MIDKLLLYSIGQAASMFMMYLTLSPYDIDYRKLTMEEIRKDLMSDTALIKQVYGDSIMEEKRMDSLTKRIFENYK